MGNGGETSRKYPEGVLEQMSCCHLLTKLPKGHGRSGYVEDKGKLLDVVGREKGCEGAL